MVTRTPPDVAPCRLLFQLQLQIVDEKTHIHIGQTDPALVLQTPLHIGQRAPLADPAGHGDLLFIR
jgi:hypothetical protein